MNTIIENESIRVEISTFGAEIQKIESKKNNKNYLFDANQNFWGRKSPVLFPFVGALKNKQYYYNGNTYSMGQHGFARDMEFELIENTQDSLWYELKATTETLLKYPFKFNLKIGYELHQNKIIVKWKVKNEGMKTMYFSIGAHPAFLLPSNQREECYIKFDNTLNLINTGLENGLANRNNTINGILETENGYLKIDKDLFKYDALILENNQVKEVSLCTPDKKEFITVRFNSPLVGIWSPYKENCPFICIEPWYGRCDSKDFTGNLEERQWQQALENEEVFEAQYDIIITI